MVLENVRPKTKAQSALLKALEDSTIDIVGAFGPSGTGKSLISLAYAIGALKEGKYEKVIIARPVIDVVTGKELTIADVGVEDYFQIAAAYLRDILAGFIDQNEIEELHSRVNFYS